MNLSSLPGFPVEVCPHLSSAHGVTTVENLQSRSGLGIESVGIRPALVALGIHERLIDQATFAVLAYLGEQATAAEPAPGKKPRKPRAKKVAPATVEGEQCPLPFPSTAYGAVDPPSPEAPIAPSPANGNPCVGGDLDFDESTPPPRTRPRGEPLPRSHVLGKGETAVDVFRESDRAGRTPLGCVLVEFCGRWGDAPLGYRQIWPLHAKVAPDDSWPSLVTIHGERGAVWMILQPPGDKP